MEIDKIIQAILDTINTIKANHVTLVNAARAAVAQFFQHLSQQIEQMLADLGSTLLQVLKTISEATEQVGNPDKLRQAGDKWSKSIGKTASTTGGHFDPNTLPTDDEWEGIAAEAYKNLLEPQQKALQETKAVADKIQVVLDDMATGIVTAWSAVLIAVTTFSVKIIAAAAIATSLVGAPAAVGLAVAAVTELAGMIATIFAALVAYIGTTVVPSARTLNQTLTDNGAFPTGAWPTTTSDLNDSSYRNVEKNEDPAHLNWHLKKA